MSLPNNIKRKLEQVGKDVVVADDLHFHNGIIMRDNGHHAANVGCDIQWRIQPQSGSLPGPFAKNDIIIHIPPNFCSDIHAVSFELVVSESGGVTGSTPIV